MSSTDAETSDQQFARQVEKVLKATAAVEQWEKAHGEVLRKVISISCPCCMTEDALKFHRSEHHLYVECATKDCVPAFRGNCRGRKRR